tara:strand:- start:80 stop:373 length:294 start_codon:yes stop_codon:yes gene_type:complete
MNNQQIILDKKEVSDFLNELVMNTGSLSNLTRLYEEMSADLEGNGDCQPYIDPTSLGALQRGIMALAQTVDRSLFEFEQVVSHASEYAPEPETGGAS